MVLYKGLNFGMRLECCLSNRVNLDKLLNLSGPWYSLLWNADDNT